MSDTAFLLFFLCSAATGYGIARYVDAVRRVAERQQRERASRRAFIEAHRPRFHPNEMLNIQERAELDDLRDYIRSTDA